MCLLNYHEEYNASSTNIEDIIFTILILLHYVTMLWVDPYCTDT